MRVIFLDVDGVLNNPTVGYGGFMTGDQPEYYHEQLKWDQDCVNHLRDLVVQSGASIVISSFWRTDFGVEDFLKFFTVYGWSDAPVISLTPEHNTPIGTYTRFVSATPRAAEILDWLSQFSPGYIESFVVLDDMSPEDFYLTKNFTANPAYEVIGSRYVRTNDLAGLTSDNVKQALIQLQQPIGR